MVSQVITIRFRPVEIVIYVASTAMMTIYTSSSSFNWLLVDMATSWLYKTPNPPC